MLKSDHIRKIIKDQGVNVVKMCIELGISQAGWYVILNSNDCKVSFLVRLANYLKRSPLELLSGYDDNLLEDQRIPYGSDKIKLLERLVEAQEENIEMLKSKIKTSK